MRYRPYLDTSVLGALCDPGPDARVNSTRELLAAIENRRYQGCISVVVLEEIADASPSVKKVIDSRIRGLHLKVLEESDECIALAKAYLDERLFPARFADDARHVAIATVTEVEALVSRNFRHLVNVERRRQIAGVNLMRGYRPLEVISPQEAAHET